MKFRAGCFNLLAVLTLLYILGGIALSVSATNDTIAGAPKSANSAAYQAGAAIGGSIGLSFFVCSGGPLLLLFVLLAWRNRVGLRTEQRHQEQLWAISSQQKPQP